MMAAGIVTGKVLSGGFSPIDGAWGLDVLMPNGEMAFEITPEPIVKLLRGMGLPEFPPDP